jgi:primosomal protein N' (replication factor Y)
MSRVDCVDVVVDVPAARLAEAFTYLVGGSEARMGARVRVPFGGRSVGGWIVSERRAAVDPESLKPIESDEEERRSLDPSLVRIAGWLHRRYACSYREAIAAVAGKGSSRASGALYRFVDARGDHERSDIIAKRFGSKPFAALAALRAMRDAGERISLTAVLRELERLIRARVIERVDRPFPKRTTPKILSIVSVADPGLAANAAQKRIVAALAGADGVGMRLADLARAASTKSQTIRRAAAAGICSIREIAATAELENAAGPRTTLVPTPEQRRAIEAIGDSVREGGVVLLQGITGSGKTLVYARAVEQVRASGGRAIVLVPEIALTPQTAGRIAQPFGSRVAVVHSAMSDGDRARVWESAANGSIDVVVGARSAVFAPLPDLRLIVVDEEHEPSYKQDVAPRYDTAAVARERMRNVGGAVVLGSATPSLESYAEALGGAIRHVRLRERATAAPLPPVEIVDMASESGSRNRRPLGVALVGAIEQALERREKVLLFVNRRGYAGLLLCRACGYAPSCRRCSISLVVHLADGSMRCHVCGDAYKVAVRCPRCSSDDLKPFGFGTQRVEEEVRALFPAARIVRMDSDTTGTRGSHRELLETFGAEADVLVGTQMIAKGLDFPTVTVVGVVAADIDLNRPDFRAAERTFGLLTQVAGRAGRAAPGARVVVQTYAPDHYAVQLAARHDYDAFATKELALRRELRYPPFGRLAYLSVAAPDAAETAAVASAIAQALRDRADGVEVLGPAFEPVAKARGEYRMRIALKAGAEQELLGAVDAARAQRIPSGVRLTAIVDPR